MLLVTYSYIPTLQKKKRAVALLVYVAVITPFDAAFLNLDFDALFMLNRFVDLMFMVVRGLLHLLAQPPHPNPPQQLRRAVFCLAGAALPEWG